MNDHEKHVAVSCVRNSSSSSDRFGVSWGEELVDDAERQKGFKYYTSFYLHGTKYRQDDTVYLHSDGGPPYIGRIGKLYESIKNKKKQMVVRWFCRPSELPAGLPDVDYNENCKDVFMMWGTGAKNVNNPACTIKHCSVVCTGGKEDWNTNYPSVEEKAAADHVFDRVYDLRTRMLRTLECIVKHYGERYVTGMALPRSTKGASTSGKRFVAGPNQLNRRPPLGKLASSDRPSLRLDCNFSELTSLPALVPSPNSPPIPLVPAGGRKESNLRKSSPSALKAASDKCKVARSAQQEVAEGKMIPKAAAHQGSKRARVDSVGNADSSDSQKRPRVGSSYASLHQQEPEKLGGSKLPSPRVGEGRMKSPLPSPRVAEVRKKSPHKPTTADASSLRQAPLLAGSKIPSPPLGDGRNKSPKDPKTAAVVMPQQVQLTSMRVGEGRKKSPNDPTTVDASWPQQAHERFAGGRLPSPGAGEGRRRSSNHLTNGDALRPQQALERLSSGKLPSPEAGEGRKRSSNALTNGNALRPQQALERLSSGRLPSPGAGEGRKKSLNDLTNADSLLSQQVQERLAGGKHSSPGAGEGRKKFSNDHTTAEPQGAAVLNRERQKGTSEISSKQSSLEAKKRHLSELRGELKKHRLSAPSHIVDVALKKEVTKVRDNVSPSVASVPKIGELSSPRVSQRSLSENGSGRQQALGREAHLSPTNQKQDSCTLSDEILNQMKASRISGAMDVNKKDVRLLSPEVAYKRSTSLDDECRSDPTSEERHCVRIQSTKEANDDGIAAPSRTHTADAKDAGRLVDSHGHEKVGKNLSPVHQIGANMKSVELNQGKKSYNARSADELGRGDVCNKQDDVEGNSEMLLKIRKASTSSHGKVLSDEVVQPIFKENRFVTLGHQNVQIEESQVKASSAGDSFASSKRAGASLEDSRHEEMGPLPKAPKISPSTLTESKHLALGPLLAGLESSTRESMVMMKSILQRTKNQSQQSGEGLKVQKNGLLAKIDPKMSSKKLSDDTRSGEKRRSPQGLVNKIAKTLARKPGSIAKVGGPPARHTTLAPSAEQQGEKLEPKKKIFKIPWEESLRIALEQRKALLLQNLDPWFSSSEVEAMLEDLLKIGCDVRMLPPKSFACYTSGEALVLFRTQKSAEEALRKLTENWLIWSKDERPVLASMADTETAVSGHIHGFYTAEMLGSRGALGTSEGQKSAVATSHCSQPNTVEYEMGINWRLLQDRHTEAWTIATKVEQNKIDPEGHQSEQKI